jgi:hypothetical protein
MINYMEYSLKILMYFIDYYVNGEKQSVAPFIK